MPLRIALVTSEVNYVKDNYESLLNKILERFPESIVALIVVKTRSWNLVFKAIALIFMGCPRLGFILLKNSCASLLARHFRAFTKKNVPILWTTTINSESVLQSLRNLDLDLIINLRTRNIYKKGVLSLPKLGCINIHHGLLPDYRGTMCDLWALYEGRQVGYSIHWMNEKIDDGELLVVRALKLEGHRNYSLVPFLSSQSEAQDLIGIIERLESGEKIQTIRNRTEKEGHSRNPSFRQIRAMRKSGIQL